MDSCPNKKGRRRLCSLFCTTLAQFFFRLNSFFIVFVHLPTFFPTAEGLDRIGGCGSQTEINRFVCEGKHFSGCCFAFFAQMPQTIFQLAHKQLTYSLIHSQLTRLTNAQNEEVNYRTKRPDRLILLLRSLLFIFFTFTLFLFVWCPSSAFYFFLFQCASTIIPDECQNGTFFFIAQQPPKTVKADNIAKVKAAA